MENRPSDLKIAGLIGITEADVTRYRGDAFLLGDGSWLIHFAFSMPKYLRQNLTGGFTLIVVDKEASDRRSSE
ncbi:hypothetical protein [Pseudomonas sichuanensis]|uniref:hypothetical protein n=1 Tax=Pseudomonas sichuanensis TaxID=2213015 RepID=UPI00321AC903